MVDSRANNNNMRMSGSGMSALARREGTGGPAGNAFGYYNDVAGNCTYGIGTLAHRGPCSQNELNRIVPPNQAQQELSQRVRNAENRIRANVRQRQLMQNQFDALASAIYDMNFRNAADILSSANRSDDADVVRQLHDNVYIHLHDAHGRPMGQHQRSRGLVNRRAGEATQYMSP